MIFHHLEWDRTVWEREFPTIGKVRITEQIGTLKIRCDDPHRHKYENAMAELLDSLGLDYADEDTGETDWNIHVMRFGKRLIYSDDHGFVECEKFDSEQSAKDWFDHLNREYSKWLDENEMV